VRILLVGALSWNPERVRSLCERGHELWGMWSRSMAWDQGPYGVVEDCVSQVDPREAAATISDCRIDCVYSLFQSYDPRLWGPPAPGVERDVWTLLRGLLDERRRGRFDAPIVRHWGFDVHNIDPDVSDALDGHIFCNREKLEYWSRPVADGGRGLDVFGDVAGHDFLDSDMPKLEFMHDAFADPLSDGDGEIHTVVAGRPFNVDLPAAARRGIHVHVYSNDVDDVHRTIAASLSVRTARREARLLDRYVHLHEPLQAVGSSWDEVREVKRRWVGEFSRYDAAWSYIGTPLAWDPLDDRAAIPNRIGTYLLAGLPVIADRRPGFYRYEELGRRGVALDLIDSDYDSLKVRLESEAASRERRANARAVRDGYSFDATIDPLMGALERAGERYIAQDHSVRTRFESRGASRLIHFYTGPRRARGAWAQRGRLLAPWRARSLARTLGTRR
jgi:hypothetical protein